MTNRVSVHDQRIAVIVRKSVVDEVRFDKLQGTSRYEENRSGLGLVL